MGPASEIATTENAFGVRRVFFRELLFERHDIRLTMISLRTFSVFAATAALSFVIPGTGVAADSVLPAGAATGISDEAQYRNAEFQAYEPVETLAKRLKTNAYSRFENPTGIWFDAGETAKIEVAGTGGEKIFLRVTNFGRAGGDKTYPLQEGINSVEMKKAGLAYISYYTPNFKTAAPVKIKIAGGKINGVFYAGKNTSEDWKKLLDNAACEVVDIVGKHVHLVYPVEELKKYCPNRGVELINVYDKIIKTEQDIMGLEKYGRQPKNRMFGRVIWKGFMHADGLGAAFHNNTMRNLADPDKLPGNSWGVAHEFGHVNQVRPGMKWVSTTEVTNNLYSVWVNYILNPGNGRKKLEVESCNDGDGRIVGGRFNSYLNSAIIAGEQWLCQRGQDKMKGYQNGGDHFVKLCPLWQLELYCKVVGKGNPDFLPDIFEIVRNTDEKGKSNGELQLAFMKNVCDTNKQDFTDFFVKVGMLKPIDKDMDDYSRGQLTITQTQCDGLIAYAKKYRKPDSPAIYYISANSVDAYAKQLPVTGMRDKGISKAPTGADVIVSHAVWKNAAAFETYAGEELVRICIAGTGSPENAFTHVRFPAGATRIEAVSWDGKRICVMDTSGAPAGAK